jgi:hypothetical protein
MKVWKRFWEMVAWVEFQSKIWTSVMNEIGQGNLPVLTGICGAARLFERLPHMAAILILDDV